ncbi:MAG TPA: hypothetical protein VFB62_21320 [Polyangiaceae bacterium]|jgi:hypothetical protein|nr:hypothetical protein [Polyangiaceae bacterium]
MLSDPRTQRNPNRDMSIRGGAVIPILGRRRKRFAHFRHRRPVISDDLVSAKTSLVRRIPLRARMARRPAVRLLALVMTVLAFLVSLVYLVA